MRYLTAACPPFSRVVLVESGSRSVLQNAIPRLRGVLGESVQFDLVTCQPGAPSALDASATIWRTQDHGSSATRTRLAREIAATRATVLAIVCSGEPIMTRWKWWLVWKVPAKVLIVNENADCFWLDTTNLRTLRRLASVRMGLSAAFPAKAAFQLALMPFIFGYLLLYASVVHIRRALRLALAPRV